MLRSICFLMFMFAACAEPRPPVDTDAARTALLEADRAFAAAAAERGLEGWMSNFAPDAVRLTMGGQAVQGLSAVRMQDSLIFVDPTRRLAWDPTDAGVFADGLHGFTTGRYAVIRQGEAPSDTLNSGVYVTIWRQNREGVWQVILDTGS